MPPRLILPDEYCNSFLHDSVLFSKLTQPYQGWLRYPDGSRVTKDIVMTVLSAVDSILVRATYSTTTTKARSGFIHCSIYSLFTPDALIVPRNY